MTDFTSTAVASIKQAASNSASNSNDPAQVKTKAHTKAKAQVYTKNNHANIHEKNQQHLSILQQNILELIKKVKKTGAAEWLFSLNTPLPSEFNSRIQEKSQISCYVKLFGKKSISGGDHYFLALHLKGFVEVACQRCLEDFMHPILVENTIECYLSETRFQALSIEDEENDTILIKADLNLLSILEDEIILAIPSFARHAKCPIKQSISVDFNQISQPEQNLEETTKPFANLAVMLSSIKNDPSN